MALNDIDKQSREIQHVNPNCLGSRYCEPHGEMGEVYYSSENVKKLITQAKMEAEVEVGLKAFGEVMKAKAEQREEIINNVNKLDVIITTCLDDSLQQLVKTVYVKKSDVIQSLIEEAI